MWSLGGNKEVIIKSQYRRLIKVELMAEEYDELLFHVLCVLAYQYRSSIMCDVRRPTKINTSSTYDA